MRECGSIQLMPPKNWLCMASTIIITQAVLQMDLWHYPVMIIRNRTTFTVMATLLGCSLTQFHVHWTSLFSEWISGELQQHNKWFGSVLQLWPRSFSRTKDEYCVYWAWMDSKPWWFYLHYRYVVWTITFQCALIPSESMYYSINTQDFSLIKKQSKNLNINFLQSASHT